MFLAEETDLTSLIKPMILFYKLSGIWIPGKRNNNFTRNLRILWRLLLILMEIIFFMTQVIYLIINIKTISIPELSGIGYLVITVFVNMIKKTFNLKNMRNIKEIISHLNRPIFQPKSEIQIDIIAKTKSILTMVYIIYMGAAIILSIFWLAIPLMAKEKKIPFSAWFPFDSTISPIFEIIFIFQIVLVTYNSILCVNLDSMAVGFLTQIGIQYDCISDSLENLHQVSKDEVSKRNNTESVYGNVNDENILNEMDVQLVNCINHHWNILDLVKQVEGLYDISIVLQFAGSTFVLCMTLFRITVVPIISLEFVLLLIYQLAATFQLFVYCWFGNEVIAKSQKVYTAAYNLKWEDTHNSFKKNLVFFLLRTQKYVELRVGGIFIISVETFISILRSSFSYFTFMRKLEKS